jgi:hypothetical protein
VPSGAIEVPEIAAGGDVSGARFPQQFRAGLRRRPLAYVVLRRMWSGIEADRVVREIDEERVAGPDLAAELRECPLGGEHLLERARQISRRLLHGGAAWLRQQRHGHDQRHADDERRSNHGWSASSR